MKEVLKVCNTILGQSYSNLSEVSDDQLRRVCIIMEITCILTQYPDVQVFLCGPPEAIVSNRCVECGNVIPEGSDICNDCIPF